MAVSKIGTGGDYSTIDAWEATLSGALASDAVGALFNELFTVASGFVFSGFTTSGTAKLIVRAATAAETGGASAKHNGTAGSGARITRNSGSTTQVIHINDTNIKHWEIRDVEIYGSNASAPGIYPLAAFDWGIVENCIVHDISGGGAIYLVNASAGSTAKVTNCAVWAIGSTTYGIRGNTGDSTIVQATNCTVVRSDTDVDNAGGGIRNVVAKNCASFYSGPTSGFADFLSLGAGSANNASSDTSGSSAGLRNLVASNQFVSAASPWDLHLKSGSALEGAGAPVAGVTTDFEGQTRDATTPDIGFDERIVGGSSSSLTAANGTLSLSGQAAGTKYATATAAAFGSLSLAGQAALLRALRTTAAGFGSFAESGMAVGFPAVLALPAGVGSLAESGQNAGLLFGARLAAADASLTLAGIAATGTIVAVSGGGLFALAGEDVALSFVGGMASDRGLFALVGQDVALSGSASVAMTVGVGAMTLAGQVAALTAASRFTAAAGGFSISGQVAGLAALRRLAADAGALIIAGQAAGPIATRRLVVDAGALALAGQEVVSAIGGAIDPAIFDLLGQDIVFPGGVNSFTLAASAGAFAAAGKTVGFPFIGRLAVPLHIFLLSGKAVDFELIPAAVVPARLLLGARRINIGVRPRISTGAARRMR